MMMMPLGILLLCTNGGIEFPERSFFCCFFFKVNWSSTGDVSSTVLHFARFAQLLSTGIFSFFHFSIHYLNVV